MLSSHIGLPSGEKQSEPLKRPSARQGSEAWASSPASGACWLYDEVNVTDSGYTLGILFARQSGEVFTFECEFTAVETKVKIK